MIDLHMHSKASDGSFTPIDLVRHAVKNGLSAIALTDHDCVDGIQEAIDEGKKLNLEVIPGLECSCIDVIHIVGLNIDYKNQYLLDELNDIAEKRKLSYFNTIENLRKLGFEVTYEDLLKAAGSDIILRPHIEKALMDKGHTYPEATNALERVRVEFGYKSRRILQLKEAVDLIKAADGIPILAHPGNLKRSKDGIRELVSELKEYGLEGIEAYYSDHDSEMTKFIEELADESNLLKSGGSDFHGDFKKGIEIGVGRGNLNIGYHVLGALKASKNWVNR